MIKLLYCLRRQPHLSREEFQKYWRERHGPLVVKYGDVLKLRRYAQSHTITEGRTEEQRRLSGRPEPYDGIAELWWESIDDFAPRNPTPQREGAAAEIATDERKFVDISRSPAWITEELVVVDEMPPATVAASPGAAVKLVYCAHRLPGMTQEQFVTYWRTNHGPLVKKYAPVNRIRRYIQSHPRHENISEAMRARQGRTEPFDGVATLWWDSLEDRLPAVVPPEIQKIRTEIFEDERKFIDHSRSPVWWTKEYVLIDR